MGARINFIFKESDKDPAVVLYSHWGETEWQRDIAMAVKHAEPRWIDPTYATRMMISYLIQDSVLEETGFGIYAVNGPNYELGDTTVVVDFSNNTIYEVGSITHVKWDAFINSYHPVLSASVG
jgi:hypothetical protein